MRRTIRCEHGFANGLCRVEGCPHEERRGKSARGLLQELKRKTCHRCGGTASARVWGKSYLCEGCASIKEARGPRGPLYLLTALAAMAFGCESCGPSFPGGSVAGVKCGDPTLQVSERDAPGDGRCARLLLPDGLDVSLAKAGDCPGPDRCMVVIGTDHARIWIDHDPTPEEDAAVADVQEGADLADGVCPLTCP